MTTIVLATLISIVLVAAYSVVLTRVVRSDGRTKLGRPSTAQLPRSHPADLFEPRPWA